MDPTISSMPRSTAVDCSLLRSSRGTIYCCGALRVHVLGLDGTRVTGMSSFRLVTFGLAREQVAWLGILPATGSKSA